MKVRRSVETFFFFLLGLFVVLYHFTHKAPRLRRNIRLTGRIAGCLIRIGLKKRGKRREKEGKKKK